MIYIFRWVLNCLFWSCPLFQGTYYQKFKPCGTYSFFDKSFNKTSKCAQIYMHVWYWDNNLNYAATHYYHSEFMGKASTKYAFESCGAYAYQVSSDGWNVNLWFPDLLKEDRNEKELSQHVHIFRLPTAVLCTLLGQNWEGSNESKRDMAQNCWNHWLFERSS